jgi:predicted Holliday junction resolvase-like endonuclease
MCEQFMFEIGLAGILCLTASVVYMYLSMKKVKKYKNIIQKTLSQKLSSEIKLGKIGENLAPFLKDWPFDANNFRFLGNPVDGIQFTDDEVIFVEIKTGKSRLTKTQKTIKELVKKGKVRFATFRISADGCTLKKEDNDYDINN